MSNLSQESREIIAKYPLDGSLDRLHDFLQDAEQSYESHLIPDNDAVDVDQTGQKAISRLLSTLQGEETAFNLRSKESGRNMASELSFIFGRIQNGDFNYSHYRVLSQLVIRKAPDVDIWNAAFDLITTLSRLTPTPTALLPNDSTLPPRPIASSLRQTPWQHNTSAFANSSEYRRDVDRVLMLELGALYVGLRHFHETYFGRVAGLETASKAVFKTCMEGSNPLFNNNKGWKGWPENANQDGVLSWFADLCEKLAAFADGYRPNPIDRRPVAQSNKPVRDSTGERKLDVCFVDDPKAGKDDRCYWSQILVPGELKSNPLADIASKAWLDLGTYAREVLAAQDTRRFVLGFTICGSLMRIWEFDRLGGLASEQFDLNKEGLQFVSTVLGFLWMSKEELGFDPTIMTADGEHFIEIERNGSIERLIIDGVMQRARCIAGRATTCWKAHRKGHPQTPLVIKDSWQYPERDEEGEILCEVTDKNIVNVARYYHHETVQIHGTDDDIQANVRGGLDFTRATNYRPGCSMPPPSRAVFGASRKGHSSSAAGKKRSSSQTDAALPRSKRSRSASSTTAVSNTLPNRVHRRVILRDYGKPIYKASSRSALLAALEGCIEGHESLRKAGFLHRDISINNLMINEDDSNPSWPSFLIDLDLAIREQREGASGAKGKTGTRAFMAIGALLGEQHSFMHDLESFFWVLFWICIHCNGPSESRVVPQFEKWNYVDTEELARMKLGVVAMEAIFMKTITDYFTPYYEPLILSLNGLRKIVFPRDKPWEREDEKLFSRMRELLRKEWKKFK